MQVQRTRLFILVILSLIFFTNSVPAQNEKSTNPPAVTASVGAGSVRFAAPGQVLQIRLEIYNAAGNLVFDSSLRKGNLIDWKITDATQAMTDGSYLCVVTVMDFQGKLRQRVGSLSLQAGEITLKPSGKDDVTAAQSQSLDTRRQSQKIEGADNNDVLTILREGKDRAVVTTTHDGQNGQVTSTTGALTFHTGDVFAGKEKEQMRVTPEGRVGIGTDKPEATLDVAGTVRARGGIVFDDGTVLTSAKGSETAIRGLAGLTTTTTTALAGTGTAGKLAKWTDNVGTLGDSVITESSGNVGIGITNPTNTLHVKGTPHATVQFEPANGNSYSYLNLGNGSSYGWQIGKDIDNGSLGGPNSFYIYELDTGLQAPRFTINKGGNVGIGVKVSPERLGVAGNIKLFGNGNGLIFPDGSVMTTASTGSGSPSGSSVVTAINDAATVGFISDARLSPNVAKLSGQNNWTGQNTFNGLSLNGTNVVNVANPVSAGDAANKAYVDANTVKFVPGAEQLSVGDANGTAPMINLRGGSTCCSGPGGHTPAWFKVFQNGSFVATGNLGIGVSPMQGKGYRTSWDSYKGAFRSGYADAEWDDANVGFFSWAGGSNSTAIGLYALAFGDTNSAESTSSIVFGSGNQVKGAAGFSAGAGNRVCDTYGVALGNKAQSGGPLINGKCDPDSFNLRGLAAVAIGYNVTADQDHTTAMGKFASNNGFTGTFIWSDGSATASADTFRNTANNEFALRATGGFRFRTNLTGTTGCNLPAGSGVFNCTSSRYTKENFLLVNGADVLSRLRNTPVSTWNYISEGKDVRHMGPMAEDFYQAFQLGTGNTSIGVQDLAGVSLAAIQTLDARTLELQRKTAEVEQLRTQVNDLRSMNAAIEQRLAALEQNAPKAATARKAKTRRR
jgi:hypothetical protein